MSNNHKSLVLCH